MSSTNQRRGRAVLLATSSLASAGVALLSAGFVALAPGAALAANECGDPSANAGAPDALVCAPATYPTGIVYPLTNGDLTLTLQDDAGGSVVTTTGGIQVAGSLGDSLTLNRASTAAGTGDPSIVNTAGFGIGMTSGDSDITIDLSDVDAGDAPIVVTGSTSGIVATSGLTGNVSLTMGNGEVTGQAGDGVDLTAGAGGSATANLGAANITASNTALGANSYGVAVTGGTGMTVTGSGTITATGDNYAVGIIAAGDGPITINQTGSIVANGTYGWGVYALGTAGGTIDITTNNVTVNQTGGLLGGGKGISAYTTGAVTINAGTTSTTGLYADGISVGGVFGIAGNTTITSGSVTTTGANADGIDVGAHGVIDITSASISTTGATSNGIEADSDLSNVVIRSTSISATGAGSIGIAATGQTGVDISSGSITAGATGIDATAATGNVLITGTGGTITGNAGDGIDAVATTGSATVNLGTTAVVSNNTAVGANAYGVSVTGATGMTVTGSGAITATGDNYAIGVIASGNGPIVINETGTITANGTYAWGVYALGTAGDSISITTSNIQVNQPGGVLGGGDGIIAYTTGAVTINSGTIHTTGLSANGIFVGGPALSPFGIAGNTVVTSGSITTTGANSGGIRVGAHGSIAITSGAITTTGANSYGIQAASDLSSVAVTSTGAISATGTGSAGIIAIGQTGVTVTANGNITANTNAISTTLNGAGAGVINVGAGAVVRGAGTTASPTILATTLTGQTTTINNAGTIRSTNATVAGAAGDLAIRGVGGNVVVNDSGRIDGRLDFTAADRVAVNTTATGSWHLTGTSTLSAGNDTVTNAGLTAASGTAIIDFGADTGVAPRDVFNNSGRLVTGETTGASTLTLAGLETFNNSGTIAFGSLDGGVTSDGQTNDRIVMTATGGGTSFVGSGSSRLVLDANLGVTGQASCAAATVADCLSLPGGTVSGTTSIRVHNTNLGPGGLNTAGIVLVDATGGSIGATSFVLDPGSSNYVTRGGAGALDTGLFFYRLVRLGTTKEALVSAPDQEAFEFVQLGAAATDAWYATSGSWFDRQADLRNTVGSLSDGTHSAVWMRILGQQSERDSSQDYNSLGTTFTFDTSYEQNTSSLIAGADLLGGGSGSMSWVIGANIGYVDTDVTFNASPTVASLEGPTYGVYGSLMAGPWYLDASVNSNMLDLSYQMPTLGTGMKTSGSVKSTGFRVEGGYRFDLGGDFFVEPMASIAMVKTSFDSLTVPGGSVDLADVDSARGSLGVRAGTLVTFDGFRLQPSLYGRVWDETKGDSRTTLNNPGLPIVVDDGFDGTFGDVGGQLSVYSDGGLTAFVNVGYKWNEDYRDTTANLGFRWQW